MYSKYMHTVNLLGIGDAWNTERVASILGLQKDLVTEYWRDYVNGKPLSVANTKGNYRLKITRVPRISLVATIVHHFFPVTATNSPEDGSKRCHGLP